MPRQTFDLLFLSAQAGSGKKFHLYVFNNFALTTAVCSFNLPRWNSIRCKEIAIPYAGMNYVASIPPFIGLDRI